MPPLTASKTPEPEDIFSGTGSSKGTNYPTSPETTASIAESPARGFGRKLVRLLFLSLGAAVIVAAGYFGYHYFFAPAVAPAAKGNINANSNTNVNAPANNENANVNAGGLINANIPPAANVPVLPPPVPVNGNVNIPLAPQDDPNSTVDSDQDGLTDYQEVHVYHTDPLKADTDADGLSDRDEVIVWHTDPLNPDTDGDGFKDGDEVKNGFNPLGPGKILTAPKIR